MTLADRRDLYRSILRTTRLKPLAVSLALGTAVIGIPLLLGLRFEYLDVTLTIRVAMVVSLSGAAFVLDDPTLATTRVQPFHAGAVAITRMCFALALITPFWVLQLAFAPHLVEASAPYNPWGLAIEAYAFLAWMWAAAWWRAMRRNDGAGGALAAPALFIVAMVLAFLPAGVALFLNPAEPGYDASRLRWLVLLLAGLAVLVLGLVRSRPISRGWRRRGSRK